MFENHLLIFLRLVAPTVALMRPAHSARFTRVAQPTLSFPLETEELVKLM